MRSTYTAYGPLWKKRWKALYLVHCVNSDFSEWTLVLTALYLLALHLKYLLEQFCQKWWNDDCLLYCIAHVLWRAQQNNQKHLPGPTKSLDSERGKKGHIRTWVHRGAVHWPVQVNPALWVCVAGIMYRKSCASSAACLIASAGYQSFCSPGKLNSVCISCCNTPLCNGPRPKKRSSSASALQPGLPTTFLLLKLTLFLAHCWMRCQPFLHYSSDPCSPCSMRSSGCPLSLGRESAFSFFQSLCK